MSNLQNFSIADLEQEIERRKSAIEVVSYDPVSYAKFLLDMKDILKDILVSEDGDGVHYAYEAAMILAFGDDVFTKIYKSR
jgi:hypothetical protein